MKRCLLTIVCMLNLLSCKEEKISSVALDCYPEFKGLERGEYVIDAPVTVQLSGGLATGVQLIVSNGFAWSGCNLPKQFVQDSLAIYVTGYNLTSKELEVMNLTPLPFEITSVRLR